jgi:hypothetical protein
MPASMRSLRAASVRPWAGAVSLCGRYLILAEVNHSPFQNSWLVKLNLMVSAHAGLTSASRIRPSSESSTMCHLGIAELISSRHLEQHSKGKDDAAADGLPIQSLQPARPQDSFPLPRSAFRAKAH